MICWAPKSGKALMPWGHFSTRGEVVVYMETNYKRPWAELQRGGWSVVKVEVKEVERRAKD